MLDYHREPRVKQQLQANCVVTWHLSAAAGLREWGLLEALRFHNISRGCTKWDIYWYDSSCVFMWVIFLSKPLECFDLCLRAITFVGLLQSSCYSYWQWKCVESELMMPFKLYALLTASEKLSQCGRAFNLQCVTDVGLSTRLCIKNRLFKAF